MYSNGDKDVGIAEIDSSAVALAASAIAAGGADAQADLAAAVIRSSVQLTADGLREAIFIVEACGPEGLDLVHRIIDMKNHQNPGSLKRLVEAIKSLSLYEHLKGFNLNLGGK